jgi:hypothetical protein
MGWGGSEDKEKGFIGVEICCTGVTYFLMMVWEPWIEGSFVRENVISGAGWRTG